ATSVRGRANLNQWHLQHLGIEFSTLALCHRFYALPCAPVQAKQPPMAQEKYQVLPFCAHLIPFAGGVPWNATQWRWFGFQESVMQWLLLRVKNARQIKPSLGQFYLRSPLAGQV